MEDHDWVYRFMNNVSGEIIEASDPKLIIMALMQTFDINQISLHVEADEQGYVDHFTFMVDGKIVRAEHY